MGRIDLDENNNNSKDVVAMKNMIYDRVSLIFCGAMIYFIAF